jgi:hypothetical protein
VDRGSARRGRPCDGRCGTAFVELAVTKRAVAGKNEAVDVLFAYLTGPEFQQRVEAIVRTFADMQTDLDEEKRVWARRCWAKRGKQIARVIETTSGMYGDLQGLLGSSLPSIAALRARRAREWSRRSVANPSPMTTFHFRRRICAWISAREDEVGTDQPTKPRRELRRMIKMSLRPFWRENQRNC